MIRKWTNRVPSWVYEISGIILAMLIGYMVGNTIFNHIIKNRNYQRTLIDIKRGHKVVAFAVDSNEKIWLMTRPFKEGEEPLVVQFTDGKRTRIVFERRNQK